MDSLLCEPMALTLTNFSESPLHLLTIVEAEILKNVVLHSVATAFASIVFPVPAGKSFLWKVSIVDTLEIAKVSLQ